MAGSPVAAHNKRGVNMAQDKTMVDPKADEINVDGLTPKQVQAVAALLTHPTIEDAAKAVGVTRETLRQWQKTPDFARSLAEAAREKIGHAANRYAYGIETAANVLIEIASYKGHEATVRIQAAKALTDAGNTIRRLSTIEEDLAEIKEMLKKAD